MPIYALDKKLWFPNPSLATRDGLLAVGGDLSSERLLLAYSSGIFPWYRKGDPIMWWSPDPRMVLFPNDFKASKSLKQSIRNKDFIVKYDQKFEEVVNHCAGLSRRDVGGSWITEELKTAYVKLHNKGYAHSVETYQENNLMGGLFGISLGKVFFGESMFHMANDASKVALFTLVEKLKEWDFRLIDTQVDTVHLGSLGAKNISRKQYLDLLKEELKFPDKKGKW